MLLDDVQLYLLAFTPRGSGQRLGQRSFSSSRTCRSEDLGRKGTRAGAGGYLGRPPHLAVTVGASLTSKLRRKRR
jgi:hypothetical protein